MLGRAQITQPGVQVERRGKVALFSNANDDRNMEPYTALSVSQVKRTCYWPLASAKTEVPAR